MDGYSYHAMTDVNGHYRIPNVLIGTYNVRSTMRRFNPSATEQVLVELDSTETADFSLDHPEFALSTNAIVDSCHQLPIDTSFSILNTGDGPLDYDISVLYAGDLSPNPWDSVGSIDVSAQTQDFDLRGCEFAFDRWWVSGTRTDGHHALHKFDLHGNYAGTVDLASTNANDWFDLAFDGHLIWGSQGHNLVGVDTLGNVVRSIAGPFYPNRAIAFDPASRHFWVADYNTDIKELDTTGYVVNTVPNPGITITGLAWNPTDTVGYKLYAFSMDGSTSLTRVTRMNPLTRLSMTSANLRGQNSDRAAGCTITPGWNSVLLVFAGLIRSDQGARLEMYEMSFNTTWINVTPAASAVQGSSSRQIAMHFDPNMLRPDDYRVDLHIRSVVYDTTLILAVRLTKVDDAVRAVVNRLPEDYSLDQNFPNPFNPTTEIRYALKSGGQTRLAVYNLLGEKVADLVDEKQSPGSYTVSFDGSMLSSGVYFYRIESGSYVQTRKMVVMK